MPGVEPGVATAAIAILPCNTGGIPGHDRLAWYRAPGRVKTASRGHRAALGSALVIANSVPAVCLCQGKFVNYCFIRVIIYCIRVCSRAVLNMPLEM